MTEANLLRVAELGLDLGWFARKFLPRSVKAEYRRQDAPLWAEYWRQEAPLRAEYKRQIGQLILALWPQGQEGKEGK